VSSVNVHADVGDGCGHAGGFPALASLGRDVAPYSRLHASGLDFVDEDHRALSLLPVEGALIRGPVPGYLRTADALALYELAFVADGDVLELGTMCGLSTGILCTAVRNAGAGHIVVSVELEPGFQRATARAVRSAGLRAHHRLIRGEAGGEVEALARSGATFGAVFVDHDHAYGPTARICAQLDAVLRSGGTALFHDFDDERNRTRPGEYGVYRAVAELVARPGYAFAGTVGCCAVVRKVAAT
jgi:predicted O-methyltransferase YrrM